MNLRAFGSTDGAGLAIRHEGGGANVSPLTLMAERCGVEAIIATRSETAASSWHGVTGRPSIADGVAGGPFLLDPGHPARMRLFERRAEFVGPERGDAQIERRKARPVLVG